MNLHFLLTSLSWLAALVAAQSTPFDPCPTRCTVSGSSPSNWTHLHGTRALTRCEQTVLFDTAIYTPIDDANM
jgi:hypothetical protein